MQKKKRKFSKLVPDLYSFPMNLHHILTPKKLDKRIDQPTCMMTFMHTYLQPFQNSRFKHAWENETNVTFCLQRLNIYVLQQFGFQISYVPLHYLKNFQSLQKIMDILKSIPINSNIISLASICHQF